MKKIKFVSAILSLALLSSVLTACGKKNPGNNDDVKNFIGYNDANWYDDSLIINNDPNWYGGVSSDKALAQKYVGREFSDVLFCVFEQTSIIPSDVQMWRDSTYNMTDENGSLVDYSSFEGFYKVYAEYKVDPFEIILDTLRENGIRPWVTLRNERCSFRS